MAPPMLQAELGAEFGPSEGLALTSRPSLEQGVGGAAVSVPFCDGVHRLHKPCVAQKRRATIRKCPQGLRIN